MRSFLVISCVLLTVFSACKKEDNHPFVQPNSFSAKVNGVPWQTDGVAIYAKNNNKGLFSIGADSSTKEGYWLCTFAINNISLDSAQSGVYPSTGIAYGGTWCYSSMSDGIADELHDFWEVIKTADNKVYVESYDAATNRVKGSFHVSLYRDLGVKPTSFLGYADTLVITDGKFDMTIKQPQ